MPAKVKPNTAQILLPYQKAWVEDTSRLKIMQKSRQIGISWASALACVERTAGRGARFDQWVSSRDDIQARLFLEDCKRFSQLLQFAAESEGAGILDEGQKAAASYVIRFKNGRRIHSMSSNPDAQAGKRGARLLDEFALHPDPRKLYSIAYPGITWGGQLEIVSTHRGSGNFFNGLVQEIQHKGNPKGFSLHTVTLQDALEQGFLAKLQASLPPDDPRQDMDEGAYFDYIRRGCASEEQFEQEYMCQPDDDEAAFLSYDLIAGCEYRPGDEWELKNWTDAPAHAELYLGADIGRTSDLTVFWLVEKSAGTYFTRKLVTLQNRTFAEQEEALYLLLGLPGLRRACMDATGLGMQLAERAEAHFGSYKVEGIRFTGPLKEQLAYPLRAAFEDKTVRIPDDPAIRADLRAVRKVTTAAGHIRFDAERSEHGHADRFWALALALRAGASAGDGWTFPPMSAGRRASRIITGF